MKKIFTLILSVAMAGALNAQTIVPKVAAQKAAGIFSKSAKVSGAKGVTANVSEPQLAYTAVLNGDTCFYVFNNPQGGYAIIGGDLIAREVLATVDNGSFDINNIPGNVKFMLEDYAQQIRGAKGSAKAPQWTLGDDCTAALMTTKWDQGAPYSNLVPKYKDGDTEKQCATGCVATAAAQAVYKALKGKNYNYGKKSKTYEHTVTNADKTTSKVSQTYDATQPIGWDYLKDTYSASDAATDDAAIAVADLMQIMGVISEMSYGSESGTLSTTLQRGLWNNLGLAAKFKHKEESGMSDQEWEQFVYNELQTGRPCIFGADTPNGKGGHEFVVDAYEKENGNFHVNWGWGGSCDGYYALTSTTAKANNKDDNKDQGEGSWMWPAEQGTGGSSDTGDTAEGNAYRNNHEMVYNLVPRSTNESQDMPEVNASDVSVSQESNKNASAKSLTATSDDTTISNIYVGDGSEETDSYVMKIGFGANGITYNGENASFIWGVELEPVFEDGQEPDEYECYILDATNGKDEAVSYKAGDVITGFTIPVGEYGWSADGANDSEGNATMKAGKYSVTPIMYFDADGDSDYISDNNIAYVAMPYGWKAPVANFVLGKKPTTAIKSVEASAQESAKVIKVIRKNRIILNKDGKQFDAAGARLN